MNQSFEMTMEEILPELGEIDSFLQNIMPGQSISLLDIIRNVLQGNWVMEPMLFWEYIRLYLDGYAQQWKKLFITLLLLFIAAAVMTSFLKAFKSQGAAQLAEYFFLLCQLLVLITALRKVMEIVTVTMQQLLDFLKLVIPSYMLCMAAAGSGLSAAIFYKLLLGFLCLIEGIVVAGCIPAIEGYMLLGVAESLLGEQRFCGMLQLIRRCILWVLRGLVVALSGSGILQSVITPVIDKANLTLMQKTAGALPGIGDIAESITSVTIASASAVKSSFGVGILLIMLLILAVPIIKVLLILGTIRLSSALGSIAGEQRMLKCTEYMTDAGFLLLRMLVTVSALFFVAIAAITKVT